MDEILTQILTELQSLKEGQKQLGQEINKIELRIENEVIEKIRALFDLRELQNNLDQKILHSLTRMETKIDALQVETAHFKRIK